LKTRGKRDRLIRRAGKNFFRGEGRKKTIQDRKGNPRSEGQKENIELIGRLPVRGKASVRELDKAIARFV